MYKIELSERAKMDIAKLKKSEPNAFKKVEKFLFELIEHPQTGTGQPEQLKHNLFGCWSRRISSKHRLVYTINEDVVTVVVLSSYGHYFDK